MTPCQLQIDSTTTDTARLLGVFELRDGNNGHAGPGDRINFSVEANFNTGSNFRIAMKDVFRPGVTPDRVFTFMADRCWGFGTFEARGNVEPRKLRLADRREFEVAMQDGVPVVNWKGLYEETLPEPIGDIFVIGTDKGEWHILTGEGYYLSRLFEADPLKIRWPDNATPGAIMDTCPPGMGDTVDFQIGTDPDADAKRNEAVLGDLRLSVGNFQGKPTAVVYRRIANEKQVSTRPLSPNGWTARKQPLRKTPPKTGHTLSCGPRRKGPIGVA